MEKKFTKKYKILDEVHGSGYRYIENEEGKKFDYIELKFPQIHESIKIDVMDDKTFNIYDSSGDSTLTEIDNGINIGVKIEFNPNFILDCLLSDFKPFIEYVDKWLEKNALDKLSSLTSEGEYLADVERIDSKEMTGGPDTESIEKFIEQAKRVTKRINKVVSAVESTRNF